MSVEPQTPESGQESVSQELPVPKFTETSADSSTSRTDTDALVKAILKELDPVLDKKLQSVKDKRIAEIEKRLDSGRFAELEAMGAQIPENVKLEYRLRELESRGTQTQSQPVSQGSGAALTAQEVSQVITDLSLDANSPEVIEALRGTYRNRDHFDSTMTRLALRKTNKQPPSLSAVPSGNTQPAPAESADSLKADFIKDMQAAKGNASAVRAIKDKYKQKGVNIYDVDFS